MNTSCESEVRVQNELSLRLSVFAKPAPVLEYIKTVSSLVGASHILAVFEEANSIQIFFDEKRFVDALIKSGIHVSGHHVRADYVVPPGIKVVLSNVHPVISNIDVLRLLSMYGTIMSPVIRPPICDDVELCHILHGVRYVYMILQAPLPCKLDIKYGDQLCCIKVKVEESSSFPCIKTDFDADGEDSSTDLAANNFSPPQSISPYIVLNPSDVPVVVSVQGTVSDTNLEDQTKCDNSKRIIPIRRRGRYAKALHLRRKKITATSQAAKRITRNVKQKWGARKINRRHFNKRRRGGRKPVKPPVLEPLASTSSSSDAGSLTPPLLNNESKSPVKAILDKDSLKLFLEEVKHQRAPIELAKKYLGYDCDNTMLNEFIAQLNSYRRSLSCHSLKLRISRLIKSLEESV